MANTFTFANQTLTDADIFGGISYICDLNTGDEFSIGNTASACVKFVTDKQVPIYTKDSTNGYFEWIQDLASRGTYYVTECVKVNGSWYSVTAYDAMILLDTSITALSLSYPLTVSAAASAIAAYIGCTVSGTIYNGTMACDALDDTTTIRQLLSWVAEASGASVKIDAADHIVFLYYAASGITVTASDYKEDGLDVADYTCAAIDNVTILGMDGQPCASSGAGTNSLFIQGNPFLYEATNTEAAVILGLVDSFVYAPFTCEMFDENGLDVGVTATFGSTTTLVMHIESSEDGAIASAVGSDSRAEFNKSLDIIVNEALSVANAAQQTADNLNLHFWYTALGSEAGAHIAEVDKPTFEANPSGGNLLSSSSGIAVRDGLTELATFGASGETIGITDGTQSYLAMDYHSMQMYDKENASIIAGGGNGVPYFYVSDLRDKNNEASITDTFWGDGTTVEFRVGLNVKTVVSVTINGTSTSAYTRSGVIFTFTTAPASGAEIEISYITESTSAKAYTLGFRGAGYVGGMSVAEGMQTVASGIYSHAEGNYTEAIGKFAHAEGSNAQAIGVSAHAQNRHTIASRMAQTAVGRHNLEDTSNDDPLYGRYAVIVGNGIDDNHRSNALGVRWNGSVDVSGGIFIKDHTNTQGAIGHFSSGSGTNSSFATGNSLTQINAPIKFSAGTWLIIGDVVYPNNTNGSRCVEWQSGATASSLASINASRVIGGTSSSGFSTRMQTVAVVQSDSDIYLSMYGYMYTGSSATVSVNWYWRAIRIA